jgi:hypothetical protein
MFAALASKALPKSVLTQNARTISATPASPAAGWRSSQLCARTSTPRA